LLPRNQKLSKSRQLCIFRSFAADFLSSLYLLQYPRHEKMWLSTASLLSLAGAATAAVVSARAGTFATAVGTRFNIDGSTKYFAGTNAYWIGFLTNDADVGTALDHMSASGLKILRVWGFNDVNSVPGSGTVYYQYLSSSGSTINTGQNGLQRLDSVVNAASSRGIKLIINFVNSTCICLFLVLSQPFSNPAVLLDVFTQALTALLPDWNDYGGINAYVNAFGGSATSWFTNSAAQAQYQKYISAVVSRYKNSTAIFAWELANEIRCHGCDTSVVYNWAKTTSAYIKSLDSNHMVTLGDEGFGLSGDGSYPYTYGEGVDFVKNLGISTLDFGTLHLYPGSCKVYRSPSSSPNMRGSVSDTGRKHTNMHLKIRGSQ
jgi:mannan endo-1,4-beta-mannosidase